MKRLKPLWSHDEESFQERQTWADLENTSAQLAALQSNLEHQLLMAKESVQNARAMETQDKEAIVSKSIASIRRVKADLSKVLEQTRESKNHIKVDKQFSTPIVNTIHQVMEVIKAQKLRASQNSDSAVMTERISYPNDALRNLSNALESLKEIKASLVSMLPLDDHGVFIAGLVLVIRHLKSMRVEEQRQVQDVFLKICKKMADLENTMTRSLHAGLSHKASRCLYALEVTTFYLMEGLRRRFKEIEEQRVQKQEADAIVINDLKSQLEKSQKILDFKDAELEANKERIASLEAELSALKEVNIRSHASLITHPVIMFTNMPSSIDVAHLKECVRKLGGSIHEGKEFCESITHVISSMQKPSIKVMAASLTQKWIIAPTWLQESERCGYFIKEDSHGKLYQERPFKDKRFFLTPAFILENKGGRFDAVVCEALIQKLGKGHLIGDRNAAADYILVSQQEYSSSSLISADKKYLTLHKFLSLIPSMQKHY